MDDLTLEYNRIHFPRNINFSQLDINSVKKTMAGDLSKLMRDRMITRVYLYPNKREQNKPYRRYGYYSLTELGKKYINAYRLPTLQQVY